MRKPRQETIKVKTFNDKCAFAVISWISYTGSVKYYTVHQQPQGPESDQFKIMHSDLINKVQGFLNQEGLSYLNMKGGVK